MKTGGRQTNNRRWRKWFRISLRTSFLVVMVICVLLGSWVNRAEQQRRAVQTIRQCGGKVTYGYQHDFERPIHDNGCILCVMDERPFVLQVACSVLPIDYWSNVKCVCLWENPSLTDTDLVSLVAFPKLEELDLESTHIDGSGLRFIKGHRYLKYLSLDESHIDDRGLAHVGRLPQLQQLSLAATQITDAGIGELSTLTKLRSLNLSDNLLGDSTVDYLRAFPDLSEISLCKTNVSDIGLEKLAQLKSLRAVYLNQTEISDRGVKSLCELPCLEDLLIDETKITDQGVAHLKGLRTLTRLSLRHTLITGAVVDQLKDFHQLTSVTLPVAVTDVKARYLKNLLPSCRIYHPAIPYNRYE